jgi:MarR family transcriptional regulator for hemolysin
MRTAFDADTFGPLLHGTARAWRLKLDQRLKPLGMSQARWRTLMHLARADEPVTQSEIAARLGIEEPTLVNLLHRLERTGWVKRLESSEDRRCKTVKLQPRARRVIASIDATASDLRRELLNGISPGEIQACVRVLERIRQRAEHSSDQNGRGKRRSVKR